MNERMTIVSTRSFKTKENYQMPRDKENEGGRRSNIKYKWQWKEALAQWNREDRMHGEGLERERGLDASRRAGDKLCRKWEKERKEVEIKKKKRFDDNVEFMQPG
jgi:hypothetical protein